MARLLRGLAPLLVASALACGHDSKPAAVHEAEAPAARRTSPLRYELEIDEGLELMSVRLCFEGAAPHRLTTRHEAGALLEHARRSDTMQVLPVHNDEILLGDLPPDACVEYGVSLRRLAEAGGAPAGSGLGGDALASPDLWLWHPADTEDTLEGTIRLHLPDGIGAAVPWPRIEGEDDAYRLPNRSFRWRSHVAFGRFSIDEILVAGAVFRVVVLDAEHAASREGIHAWLRAAGETVAGLYGEFPVSQVTLIVAPTSGPGSDPVHFGHVTRGGGASILLLLDADASDDQLPGEWVAIHEMLHLGMPYVDPRDAWLSEGFATYYTQVLRARAGLMPGASTSAEGQAQGAVRTMEAGFARARRSAVGLSLAEASLTMHQTHAYPRVYWGGAAIAFASDMAIRRASAGKRSLDDAMRELQAACTSLRVWRAEQLLERMDSHLAGLVTPDSNVSPLGKIARAHLKATQVPALEGSFEALGTSSWPAPPSR